MDLLRDIIFALNPDNRLGRPSTECKATRQRYQAVAQRRLNQRLAAVTDKADHIIAHGGTVPTALKRFAGSRTTVNRSRRVVRGSGQQ